MVGGTTLDSDAYVALLRQVGDDLRSRRVKTEIYIFGGAAMSLAGYLADRRSDDLDVRIKSNNAVVVEAANRVARRAGLPSGWLNEAGTSALPRKPDLGQRTVFVHDNLIARAASPRFMLAMKLYAARGGDGTDALVLAQKLSLDQTFELHELLVDVYEDRVFSDRERLRTDAFVEDLARELQSRRL